MKTPLGGPGHVAVYRRTFGGFMVRADSFDLAAGQPTKLHDALIQATRLFLAEQWLASNPHIAVTVRD